MFLREGREFGVRIRCRRSTGFLEEARGEGEDKDDNIEEEEKARGGEAREEAMPKRGEKSE